jgi:hypothetical protein
VAAVVQARERIAHALLLEFEVLGVQLRVRVADLAVQEPHHDGGQRDHDEHQPPDTLLQAAVVDLGRFDRILAAQQFDLALLAFGLVFFLQLEHRLLAALFEQFVRQLALAVVGLQGARQVAHALQRHAVFHQRGLQLGLVAHFFIAGDTGLDMALAVDEPSGSQEGLAQVQVRDRVEPAIVQRARRIDRLLGVADSVAVVPRLEIPVGQIDQGAGNTIAGADLALERQAFLQHAQRALILSAVDRQAVFHPLEQHCAAGRVGAGRGGVGLVQHGEAFFGFAHLRIQARQGIQRHHDMDRIATRACQCGGALQALQGTRQVAFLGIRFARRNRGAHAQIDVVRGVGQLLGLPDQAVGFTRAVLRERSVPLDQKSLGQCTGVIVLASEDNELIGQRDCLCMLAHPVAGGGHLVQEFDPLRQRCNARLVLEGFEHRQGALWNDAVDFPDLGQACIELRGVAGKRTGRHHAQGQGHGVESEARQGAMQDSEHAVVSSHRGSRRKLVWNIILLLQTRNSVCRGMSQK